MIDVEPVQNFERGFATMLDAVDKLRALEAPKETDDIAGLVKWAGQVKEAVGLIPDMPDAAPLAQFAEEVQQAVSNLEDKADGGGLRGKPHPHDDGILAELPTLFRVTVTEEGGAAGDADNDCAFTYTVTSLAGDELGTAKTPEKPRYDKCMYVQPTADSPGLAYWDSDNVIHLYEALEEIPDTTVCP